MIHIYGLDRYPRLRVFEQVASSLKFEQDIYLGAQVACFTGEKIKNKVIYNMEPLYEGSRPLGIGYFDLLKSNTVLDYSAANVDFLHQFGIDAFHLPYGFHPELERFKDQEKTIDVLFVGSHCKRREEILGKLARRFRVEWHEDVYGSELDALSSRARVHLNIHFTPVYQLEVVRLNYLLANNQTVVSEPGCERSVNAIYSPHVYMTWDVESAVEFALTNPLPKNNLMNTNQMDCSCAQDWLNKRY